MASAPTTRPSLLLRIRDSRDEDAWRQFVRLYTPVVYGYARRRGLQDADAADVAQEVLRTVAATVGKFDYDQARGTFRSWLFTLAHHRLCDFLTRRKRGGQSLDDPALQAMIEQQAVAPEPALWDREYEARLFDWAARQAREQFEPTTWQAFWLTAVENQSGKEAAEKLGISVAAVYLAKSRVLARLRQLIEEVERP
jgi:RNA polymerase sigma factor (sigma-70 family)